MSFDGLNVTNIIRRDQAGGGSPRLSFQGDQHAARTFLVELSNSAVRDGRVLSGNLRLVIDQDGSATLEGRRFRRDGNSEANALVLDAVDKAYGSRAGDALRTYLLRTEGTLGSHSLVRLVAACESGMTRGGAKAPDVVLVQAAPKASTRLIAGELSALMANDLRERLGSAAGRSSLAGDGVNQFGEEALGSDEVGQKVGDGRVSLKLKVEERRASADSSRHSGPANENDDVQPPELSESDSESESDTDDSEAGPDDKRAPRVPLRLPVMTALADRHNDAPSALAAAALDLLNGPRVPHLASLAADAYAEEGDLERLVEFFHHALPPAGARGAGNPESAGSRHKAHINFIALLAAYEHPLALSLARRWIEDVPQADQQEVRDALNQIPFQADPTLSEDDSEGADLEGRDFKGRVLEDGLTKAPKSLTGSLIMGPLSGRFKDCDLSNNIVRAEVAGALRFSHDVDLSNSAVVLRPSIEPTGNKGETPEFPTINFAGARLDGASIDLDLGRLYKHWREGYISESSLLKAIGQQDEGGRVPRNCMLSAVASVPDEYPAIKANLMKQVLFFADRAGVLPDAREALIVVLWKSRALYLADPGLAAMIGKIDFLNESLAKASLDEALAHSARWDERAAEHRIQRLTGLLKNVATKLINVANVAAIDAEDLTDGLKALLAFQRTLDDCRDLLTEQGLDGEQLIRATLDERLSQFEAEYGRRALAGLVDDWRTKNARWGAEESQGLVTREERSLLRHYLAFVELIGERFSERAWLASGASNSHQSAESGDDASRKSAAVQPSNLRQAELPPHMPARPGQLPPSLLGEADGEEYEPVIIESLEQDDEIVVDRAMVEALLEPEVDARGRSQAALAQPPLPEVARADGDGFPQLIIEEVDDEMQAQRRGAFFGAILEPESIPREQGLIGDRPPIEALPKAAPPRGSAQSLPDKARAYFEGAGRSIGRKQFGVALTRAIMASQQYERSLESEKDAAKRSPLKQQMDQQIAEFKAQFKAASGKAVGKLETLQDSRKIRAELAHIIDSVKKLKQSAVQQPTLDACNELKRSAPVKDLSGDMLILSPARYYAALQAHTVLATHYATYADKARAVASQIGLPKEGLAKATGEVNLLMQKAQSALAVADEYATALAGNSWVDRNDSRLKELTASVASVKTRLGAR